MHAASFGLCKALYALSGWNGENTSITYWWVYKEFDDGSGTYFLEDSHAAPFTTSTYPAYDLGYLLRKLPDGCTIVKEKLHPGATKQTYNATKSGRWLNTASTPEDAACLLAIELLKHGILKMD